MTRPQLHLEAIRRQREQLAADIGQADHTRAAMVASMRLAREAGATFQQVADAAGVSVQRAHQLIGPRGPR